MVGCRSLACVNVDACHEVSFRILGQFLYNVYRLAVLTLGVSNVHCLVLAYQNAGVTDLTTHLTVERCVVQYEFVVCVLLLCHLAIAQDVALVFGEVVAHELLFALAQVHPVAVLNGCCVACAFLLLLHLGVEFVLSYSKSVLTADEFGEVEGESVGVEEAESLHAVELCLVLLLKLFHSRRKEVDALLECAEE